MTEFDILTLFPGLCEGAFSESMLKKAQENRLIRVRCLDLREWAAGKHRVTDEPPYGGGPGMVMKAEPIFAAVATIRRPDSYVILMSAAGQRFTQQKAQELAEKSHLIFVCGHYEGVDQRVADHLADEELSIGDYVLTNGAIAATVVVDAVARLIPGVLGEAESATDESFSHGLLEYPHYTRPAVFQGWEVPDVLLSGNHAAIDAWRKEEARRRTAERRPDSPTPSRPGTPTSPSTPVTSPAPASPTTWSDEASRLPCQPVEVQQSRKLPESETAERSRKTSENAVN
jgi:tRNA (guanine37-N1)-methyltransferase